MDTAKFLQVVRDWFNTVNVKGTNYGQRTRDERRNAIRRASMNEDLEYLSRFVSWLEKWKNSGGKGLSKPTFECAIRSCKVIIELVPYLFERYPDLEFILLGNICSDFLEGRFGWYRQLCGGNYYNAVVQFLQAEDGIRDLVRSRGLGDVYKRQVHSLHYPIFTFDLLIFRELSCVNNFFSCPVISMYICSSFLTVTGSR